MAYQIVETQIGTGKVLHSGWGNFDNVQDAMEGINHAKSLVSDGRVFSVESSSGTIVEVVRT